MPAIWQGKVPSASASVAEIQNQMLAFRASALPGKLTLPKASNVYKRPDPNADDDPPERTGPPNFGSLPPGAQPEDIFAAHRVYSMNVDMPNLNSVTGSWIIHFSEMHLPGVPHSSAQLNAPDLFARSIPNIRKI